MSREILDSLKRERDICVKNVIHSQNTAFMFIPALRELIYAVYYEFDWLYYRFLSGNKKRVHPWFNLVPRAHVSFGQRQDTELWNNPFQESKILGLPVSRRMRALA